MMGCEAGFSVHALLRMQTVPAVCWQEFVLIEIGLKLDYFLQEVIESTFYGNSLRALYFNHSVGCVLATVSSVISDEEEGELV